MATQDIEVFVHGQGAKPVVVAASTGETLRDVLVRAGDKVQGCATVLLRFKR